MILTEYFEISGIFQRFLFSREGVFQQFSDSFPTKNQNQMQQYRAGREPTSTRVTICYSTTAPHLLYIFAVLSALSYPLSVSVLLCQQCVNCVYLRQCCVFLRQYSVHLRQYCVFLRQYSVHLCQYWVFLRQYCVFLRQFSSIKTVFFFINSSPSSILCFSSSVLC